VRVFPLLLVVILLEYQLEPLRSPLTNPVAFFSGLTGFVELSFLEHPFNTRNTSVIKTKNFILTVYYYCKTKTILLAVKEKHNN
jgi:hypothetical protein